MSSGSAAELGRPSPPFVPESKSSTFCDGRLQRATDEGKEDGSCLSSFLANWLFPSWPDAGYSSLVPIRRAGARLVRAADVSDLPGVRAGVAKRSGMERGALAKDRNSRENEVFHEKRTRVRNAGGARG